MVEAEAFEGGVPVLDVVPYLVVAAADACHRLASIGFHSKSGCMRASIASTRLDRLPLEVGMHARQHRVDVTSVQCLDDLAHQPDARLHKRAKYRADRV